MGTTLRRVGRDIKNLRYLEAYTVTALAVIFAVLSVIGDIVPTGLRWGTLFAGLGLLVFRITVPEPVRPTAEAIIGDRAALEELQVNERLKAARAMWLYAPTAINFLTPERCDVLRKGVLSHDDGSVRIIVLDPAAEGAVDLAARQLDDSIDFTVQRIRPSLAAMVDRLQQMAKWPVHGSFEYRLLAYNPGFSLVLIDPEASDGLVIAEVHGFHNESVAARLHLVLTRGDSERWFAHWVDQFDHMWNAAVPREDQGEPS